MRVPQPFGWSEAPEASPGVHRLAPLFHPSWTGSLLTGLLNAGFLSLIFLLNICVLGRAGS